MIKEPRPVRRYELKYTINEEIATAIKEYIKPICSLDKHVPPGDIGYTVNNLYFDTPGLQFYNDTKHRKLTRYKPRARYYGMTAKNLIWPEIKYRNSNVIWKNRYSLPVEKWPSLFYPEKSKQITTKTKNQLERFEELIYWHQANPVIHVRYFREPYVTELEEYGRVTFDRQLSYRAVRGSISLDYNESDMLYYDDAITTKDYESLVLLEIKVETLIPLWAIEMIRIFDLKQRPFSKYCYGVDNTLNYFTVPRISVF